METARRGRDPRRWEEGCRTDEVRNLFVLPDLVERLARIHPRLIADVGSGTGYMSRQAALLHTRRDVEWILLENDPEMLEMAINLSRQDELIVPVLYDLLGTDASWSGRFDFAFSCFSSLDFGMDSGVAARLTALLRPGGVLVFYLPDLLEDVAQVCVHQGSMHAMDEYRRGAVSIGKPDRFTKEAEPFVAHRLERCISDMLSVGTILSDLRFLERGGDRRLVTMEFKRLA